MAAPAADLVEMKVHVCLGVAVCGKSDRAAGLLCVVFFALVLGDVERGEALGAYFLPPPALPLLRWGTNGAFGPPLATLAF